jgi:prevent-host-death family protein
MPTVVNIHEAKTHLSRLLEAVERGEEVVIARAGHPIATLSPYRPPRRRIAPPGSMQGRDWWMSDDFNAPIDDLFESLSADDQADLPSAS